MKRLIAKATRVILTACAGLLIITALPGSGAGRSAAAPQPMTDATPATTVTPAPTVFFEPTRIAPAGAQPFVLILCKFADVDETWQTPADFERLLFGPEGLDAYWREASYDGINLEGSRAVGWYTLPDAVEAYRNADGSDVDLGRLAADCTAAADANVNFPDYFGIGLAFNRNLWLASRGGGMCLDLDGAARCYGALWLWPTNARNRALVAHEMGHAFGLSHSMGVSTDEFGNAWDVMSQDGQWWPDAHYNPPPQHMIAYHKDTLGWIEAHRKYVVADEGTVAITLERLAQPGASGYLLAQIPIAGSAEHFYTVEARRMAGFDALLPADAVVIHEVDTRREVPAVLVSRAAERDLAVTGSVWNVGQVFSDKTHGISVAVDAETETGFVVTISTGTSR
jgi:hypothetical protein